MDKLFISESHADQNIVKSELDLPMLKLNVDACLFSEQRWNSRISFDTDSGLFPESRWGPSTSKPLHLSMKSFEKFTQEIEHVLGVELEKHCYNTLGNFTDFYGNFVNSGRPPFRSFFMQYKTVLNSSSLNCVGLSLSLIRAICSLKGKIYSQLSSRMFIASSEIKIPHTDDYCDSYFPPKNIIKRHAVVVIKIEIEGRSGVILLDPGFHISKPIIVMEDEQKPHTGDFVPIETAELKKELYYRMKGKNYVECSISERRKNREDKWMDMIFIDRNFESYIEVTEKRNLILNFRSLVKRNKNGPIAGLFLDLERDPSLTLFYNNANSHKEKHKIPFDYLINRQIKNMDFEKAIEICAHHIGKTSNDLRNYMEVISLAYEDSCFMPYLLKMNKSLESAY